MTDGAKNQFTTCVHHLTIVPHSNIGAANKGILLGSGGVLIGAEGRWVSLDVSTEGLETTKKLKPVASSTRCDVVVGDETMVDTDSFYMALKDYRLTDLGFIGHRYTWKKGSKSFTKAQLDRGVGNGLWRDIFPNNMVEYLITPYSDHAPLLLRTDKKRGY